MAGKQKIHRICRACGHQDYFEIREHALPRCPVCGINPDLFVSHDVCYKAEKENETCVRHS